MGSCIALAEVAPGTAEALYLVANPDAFGRTFALLEAYSNITERFIFVLHEDGFRPAFRANPTLSQLDDPITEQLLTGGVDWSQAEPARFPNLKPSTKTISLRLPVALLARIKVEANKRDIPYQSLESWLFQKARSSASVLNSGNVFLGLAIEGPLLAVHWDRTRVPIRLSLEQFDEPGDQSDLAQGQADTPFDQPVLQTQQAGVEIILGNGLRVALCVLERFRHGLARRNSVLAYCAAWGSNPSGGIREYAIRPYGRVHLLHHAAEEPFYGMAMLEELQRHGYRLSPGTLYPILHGLEKAAYLSVERAVVGGKAASTTESPTRAESPWRKSNPSCGNW